MKVEEEFGDLDDDIELPTEKALAEIEHGGVGDIADEARLAEQEIFDMPVIRLPRMQGGTGWEHEDVCNVRQQLTRYIDEGERSIAIDFTEVLMVDKGAFGMFSDMVETHDVNIYLLHPSPAARDWYWFQMFAEDLGGGRFRIRTESLKNYEEVALPGLFNHKSRLSQKKPVNLET